MTLAAALLHRAQAAPEHTAIASDRLTLSYAGLSRRIDAAAAFLAARGVARGHRIAVLAATHPLTLVLLFACARLGAMLLPLNWRLAAPDPRWQEVPVAHLVLRPGAACTETKLRAHLRAHLAAFKCPRDFRFVDTLPRNAMGKIQRALLRAEC